MGGVREDRRPRSRHGYDASDYRSLALASVYLLSAVLETSRVLSASIFALKEKQTLAGDYIGGGWRTMGLLRIVVGDEAHEQCGFPSFLRGAWAIMWGIDKRAIADRGKRARHLAEQIGCSTSMLSNNIQT
jgi:hypothetical protein